MELDRYHVVPGHGTAEIHAIPGGLLRVEPAAAPSGAPVTIAGEGFRPFVSVSTVEFAGRGTLGGRTVNTDGQGNLLIPNIVVPGLDPGIVDVTVNVAGETAITIFEVTDSGEGQGLPATEIMKELEPLGENLERVFYFNNSTKTWSFFDPRPEFAKANSLKALTIGKIYWIKVFQDVEATLNGRSRNLTCLAGNCWNQITL